MVEHMKWWGWGQEGVAFHHEDKPGLAPFARRMAGIDFDAPPVRVPELSELTVPASQAPEELRAAFAGAVGAEHVHDDDLDRVVHCYGKSMRDLVRIRRGDFGRLPDLVVYPGTEAEVEAALRVALDADAVLIPFGGGSNIVGSLEAPREETRPVVSLDLGRLRSLLELDETSQLARIQAGALGPDLEAQLNARGWTLGHFPDSFKHSTLGGWIATRSSGMQSDRFGDIADITRAVRVVTPKGVVATRQVPVQAAGPSVREMVLGSEGRLGVITEATVQVHRLAEERVIQAYFFPDYGAGLKAMHDIAASDASPSITRVSDEMETQFTLATSKKGSALSQLLSRGVKLYAARGKGFDLEKMCLSFIGFEGSSLHVKRSKRLVDEIVKRHGGFGVGTGPGTLYDQKKFDTPYIRDFILDRGAYGDVSETSSSWATLKTLHDDVVAAAQKAFAEIGTKGFVFCHLSHSYHSGACQYFTFAFQPPADRDGLEAYDIVKGAIQQAFIDNGGTLSHHHAVGREHKPWVTDDLSPAGAEVVKALFAGVDPGRNLNPGAIVD
ncbi:FAD-binding oxidoreductase [Paenibacillus sp. TRM 82003]|uniref:FAD-binding oxidoreductase n=1 Tax=Kineococcus sp. TRM81007 TaxID=2925831 RepID=UPI001F56DCFF|nr:FAD-binding oxidoreductase [Kineococcus sp. TRM81007]MCI2238497.1 FAD-binding oxidoreductase [Kineococcus sp. TRM81007]MCI3921990.1 FAD-binding oxidoreductase [Paenibacillus sp. TRM 82003]